jgi:predicted transcriptional regulator
LRQQAIRYSLEGLSQHKVARLLGVSQQSVGNWLKAAQVQLAQQENAPVPREVADYADEVIELDELHTFIGQKRGQKNNPPTS